MHKILNLNMSGRKKVKKDKLLFLEQNISLKRHVYMLQIHSYSYYFFQVEMGNEVGCRRCVCEALSIDYFLAKINLLSNKFDFLASNQDGAIDFTVVNTY